MNIRYCVDLISFAKPTLGLFKVVPDALPVSVDDHVEPYEGAASAKVVKIIHHIDRRSFSAILQPQTYTPETFSAYQEGGWLENPATLAALEAARADRP